jgi:hypothetical protein
MREIHFNWSLTRNYDIEVLKWFLIKGASFNLNSVVTSLPADCSAVGDLQCASVWIGIALLRRSIAYIILAFSAFVPQQSSLLDKKYIHGELVKRVLRQVVGFVSRQKSRPNQDRQRVHRRRAERRRKGRQEL